MLLKKSLNLLKEKFYPLFFSELVFLFVTFFFLVFAKNKLAVYILQIQDFSAKAAALQQGTDQMQVLQFLEGFEQVTSHATTFAYIVIPLVLGIIWLGTQTWFWYILQKQKIKHTKKYLMMSIGGQIVLLLLLYLELLFIPLQFSVFDTVDVAILKTIIGSILFFILFVFLSGLNNQSAKTSMQETLQKLKRSHKFVLPFILLCAVFFSLAFLFFTLFTTYMTGNIVLFSTVPMVLYLIVMMMVFIWLKLVFFVKAQEV